MSISKLKDDWKTSFEEAIQSIENSLQSQSHDCSETSEFRTLANWLMTVLCAFLYGKRSHKIYLKPFN